MMASVRPNHPPAWPICPRIIKQNASQNEHRAASDLFPVSTWRRCAASHAAAQPSSSPIKYDDTANCSSSRGPSASFGRSTSSRYIEAHSSLSFGVRSHRIPVCKVTGAAARRCVKLCGFCTALTHIGDRPFDVPCQDHRWARPDLLHLHHQPYPRPESADGVLGGTVRRHRERVPSSYGAATTSSAERTSPAASPQCCPM